jgi:hypothetical protein
MVDEREIRLLMFKYFIDDYTDAHILPKDYYIDVNGLVNVDVHLVMAKPTPNRMLPVQFGVVKGDFVVSGMKLTSLRGAPYSVNGDFACSMNNLTSLEHAPKTVRAGYSLLCDENKLTSLAHAPVAEKLVCDHNLLKNLVDAPPCKFLWATQNPFESFKHTPDHIEQVMISYAPNLPLLGLLNVAKIELGPTPGYNYQQEIQPIEEILNKYTRQGKVGQLKCAAELIRAGFKDHAYI